MGFQDELRSKGNGSLKSESYTLSCLAHVEASLRDEAYEREEGKGNHGKEGRRTLVDEYETVATCSTLVCVRCLS